MRPLTPQATKPQSKTAFVASVTFMAIAWLLLSGFLALFWAQGVERISTFKVVFLTLLVSAWAFIPVQMLRYFRERRNRSGS